MGNLIYLDGALGTQIWKKTGESQPVWIYNILQPDVVREVAAEYVAAGSDIIYSNTFSANRIAVEYSSDYSVEEVVSAGVRLAKEATEGTDVKVALSIGPLTELMEPYGDLTEEEVADIYNEMFEPGIKAGADLIVLETFIDLSMLCVAAQEAKKYGVPVLCSMSFEAVGRTMFGNSVEDVISELSDIGVDAVGLNCSLGPDIAVPIIKTFAQNTDLPILFKPNAGKPIVSADGTTENPYSKEDFARDVAEALPLVTYIGGCCGTDPSYIEFLKNN